MSTKRTKSPQPASPPSPSLNWSTPGRPSSIRSPLTADPVQSAQLLVQPSLSSCTAFTGGLIGVPAGGIAIDSTGTQLTIIVQEDFSSMGTLPAVSDPTKLTNCTLNLKLHLTMKSFKIVDLALPANTQIAYPQPAKPTFQLLKR
jgi:hypothetical protein